MAYGLFRIGGPSTGASVRVGAVAVGPPARYYQTTDSSEAMHIVDEYARIAGQLIDDGAMFVVTPEKFVGVTRQYESTVERVLGEATHQRRALIVAGLNRVGSEHHRNFAAVISREGKPLTEYDKAFLLPGIESEYTGGKTLVNFEVSDLIAGLAICKDLDFPSWIRQYGKSGTGILFVPAWDFTSDAWLHSRMAIMRAVENDFAMVRSANQGLLTVCDSRGRVVREASSIDVPEVHYTTDVIPGSGRSFYSRTGDWFAWINLLLLPVFGFTLWRARKRTEK